MPVFSFTRLFLASILWGSLAFWAQGVVPQVHAASTPVVDSRDLKVELDCYLPGGLADCTVVQGRLTGGPGLRPSKPGERADVRLEVREERGSSGNGSFTQYHLRFYDDPKVPRASIIISETVPDGVPSDIASQRVSNRALLGLAAYGRIKQALFVPDGSLVITAELGSSQEESKPEDKEKDWGASLSISGRGTQIPNSLTSVNASISADFLRSTPQWLFHIGPGASYSYQRVQVGEDYADEVEDYQVGLTSIIARAIKGRWSVALIPQVSTSPLVNNYDINTSILAGVEFNLVPFNTGNSNGNFSVRYAVGPGYANYRTETITGETQAVFVAHAAMVTGNWHFKSVDPSVSARVMQDLTRPEFISFSVYAGASIRLGERVALTPYISYSQQTAARNQPASQSGGTLAALQSANSFASSSLSGGLTLTVSLGNPNKANQDNRWRELR